MFALLLTEGALWTFIPIEKMAYQVKIRPELRGVKDEVVLDVTRFGVRSASLKSLRKGARTIRVMCIGASTTQSEFQSSRDAWWGILEAQLQREFPEKKIELIAYGEGGAGAFRTVEWVRQNRQRYQPDVVVTLLGINDLVWHGGAGYHYDRAASLAHVRNVKNEIGVGTRVRTFLSDYSQLYNLQRAIRLKRSHDPEMRAGRALDWGTADRKALQAKYQRMPAAAAIERAPDPVEEFADGMEALLKELKDIPEVVVMGQPVLWKEGLSVEESRSLWFQVLTPKGPVRPSAIWAAQEMAKYNERQRGIAERYGRRYVDLPNGVTPSLDNFVDDCHFTDLGSHRVADVLLPTVRTAIAKIARLRSH